MVFEINYIHEVKIKYIFILNNYFQSLIFSVGLRVLYLCDKPESFCSFSPAPFIYNNQAINNQRCSYARAPLKN